MEWPSIDSLFSVLRLANLQLHNKIKLGLAIKQFKQLNNIAMLYSESKCVSYVREEMGVLMKYDTNEIWCNTHKIIIIM